MGAILALRSIANLLSKCTYLLIFKYLIVLVVFPLYLTSEYLSTQLGKPCEFPSPDSLHFSRLCQFDYHQVPYLCDPSGMMSRTETELLDRHVQRLLNGNDALGCVCPPIINKKTFSTSNQMHSYFGNQKNKLQRNKTSTTKPYPQVCNENSKKRENSFQIATILVPYSSIESVNICLNRHLMGSKLKALTPNVRDFPEATLSFAKQLMHKWINASNSKHFLSEQTSCHNVDIFIVYVQNWMPTNILRPFVAWIYRRRLKNAQNLESVHRVQEDASPFETLMHEMTLAIKHMQGGKSGKQGLLKSLEHENDKETSQSDEYNSNISGVPKWAYLLVVCLLTVVLITVYIGNCVNRRLTLTQQQKKYSNANAARHGVTITANTGNDRARVGFGGGFLMGGGGAGSMGGSGNASMNCTVSGQASGASSGAPTKSSMMFRQFSGPGRRHASGRNVLIQKI